MLDTLEDSSVWEMEQVLKNSPAELGNVYDLMLRSVTHRPSKSVKSCQKFLYWWVTAGRLLTVDELLMALAVSKNVESQGALTLDPIPIVPSGDFEMIVAH